MINIIKKAKPTIYIDTNILRDCRTKRNENSLHMMRIIKKNKWKCISSVLSIMELIDIEKEDVWVKNKIKEGWEVNKILRERYDKKLNLSVLENISRRIDNFLKKYYFVEFLILEGNEWVPVLKISSGSNLLFADVIHFTTALVSNVDLIITSDEKFLKCGKDLLKSLGLWENMKICKPHETVVTLRQMGFNI